MITFSLTDEERDVLSRALGLYLSELRMEIVDTENWEYRAALKHEKNVLDGIAEALDLSAQKALR
jgi:hypothetical protein